MNAAAARQITPTTGPVRLRSRSAFRVVLEGRRVGEYRLGARLGRGGMGVVHAATDRGGRDVAVKLLHPHLADDPELTRMFYDEAAVACRVDHPNVCRVHDFGRHGELLYLAMEKLHGTTLGAILREHGELPLWLAARVMRDAARGLHAAHELTGDDGAPLGVVHRDVSPQNVIVLFDGGAKIVDFGVARTRGRVASTAQGVLKGKLAYMSPEQIEELPLDRRADVWGLGVLLWESVAGRRLFKRGSHLDVARAVLTADVPDVRTLRPDCPPALAEIIERALQEEPMLRYASAEAFADALDAYLQLSGQAHDAERVASWMCQFVETPTVETELDVTELDEPSTRLLSHPRAPFLFRATMVALVLTLLCLITCLLVIWGTS